MTTKITGAISVRLGKILAAALSLILCIAQTAVCAQEGGLEHAGSGHQTLGHQALGHAYSGHQAVDHQAANLTAGDQQAVILPALRGHSGRSLLSQTIEASGSAQQDGLLRPPINNLRQYTLSDAVSTALKNYPSIKALEYKRQATSAKISLAKTEYLPHFDLFLQELRGSTNNVLGILFPPLNIPQVSGPVDAPINFNSVWACNASAFFSWELVDFGLRGAKVRQARQETDTTLKHLELTRFDVAVGAAQSFFTLLACRERVRAQKAYVERMKVFAMTVHALVKSDLRPGVDASRADAELAKAEDKLILAEQEQEIARARFAERIGLSEPTCDVDSGPLLTIPESPAKPSLPPFEYHPVLVHQDSVVKTVQSRIKVLQKQWYPHIFLETALFARGSGRQPNRSVANLGWLPNVPNWAVGFKAQFPVMEIFAIKANERDQKNVEQEERARYSELLLKLKSADAQARALIDGASKLAKNAPVFLKAAQDTELRARTRYGVGLNTIVDVAEAEQLLTDAQVTYNLAGLGVWRSYLAASEAHGDLAPFLQLVNQAAREGSK